MFLNLAVVGPDSYSGFNENSLRSNDSDEDYDNEASPSGQEDTYGAEAVLAWAEVCAIIWSTFCLGIDGE